LQPDLLLTGEYGLKEHGIDGRIIHTPGHTPGSVSVLLDQGDLIAGDMLTGGFLGLLQYRPSNPPFHDESRPGSRQLAGCVEPGPAYAAHRTWRPDACDQRPTLAGPSASSPRFTSPAHGEGVINHLSVLAHVDDVWPIAALTPSKSLGPPLFTRPRPEAGAPLALVRHVRSSRSLPH
jgi:hypothetical protein